MRRAQLKNWTILLRKVDICIWPWAEDTSEASCHWSSQVQTPNPQHHLPVHLLSTLPHPKRGSQRVVAGRICPLQWGAAGIGGHRLGAHFEEEEGILQAEGKRICIKQDQRSFILSLCFCAAISIIPFSFSYLTFISRENHRRMTWDSSPAPAKPDSKQGSATTFCDEILIENSATQEEVQNSRSPLYTNLFLFNSSLAVSEHFSSLHTKNKKQNKTVLFQKGMYLVRNFKIN